MPARLKFRIMLKNRIVGVGNPDGGLGHLFSFLSIRLSIISVMRIITMI